MFKDGEAYTGGELEAFVVDALEGAGLVCDSKVAKDKREL